jgi:RNA polymerase sigma-70 factor, ECF subfamily
MNHQDWQAEHFEQHRPRLRAVSYRMLGSLSEADDAVQEAWLRFSSTDTSDVNDLGAWLTTVVARLCLNTLRSRKARPEEPIGSHLPDPIVSAVGAVNPEDEALIADSVGLALLIVLDSLAPAERLAFVLHDVFDVPFEQVAAIVDRSEAATRQLASRARRRLQTIGTSEVDVAKQWELVDAFLAAAREGDFEGLLKVLDPDVVRRVDAGAMLPGVQPVLRGARAVASGALAFQKLDIVGRRALVNGGPGVVSFAGDRPVSVVGFTIAHGKIVEMNILVDPDRVRQLDLTVVGP